MFRGALFGEISDTRDDWSGLGIPRPHPIGLLGSGGVQCLIGLGMGGGRGGMGETERKKI